MPRKTSRPRCNGWSSVCFNEAAARCRGKLTPAEIARPVIAAALQ